MCGEGACRQPPCSCHSLGEDHEVCIGTCLGKHAELPGGKEAGG